MTMSAGLGLGAVYLGDGRCRFTVWAPLARKVDLHIVAPRGRLIPMTRVERGYHRTEVTDVEPGSLYFYILDGRKERPDPASRHQPRGVHGPSRVVDLRSFAWTDRCWFGPSRQDLVFYEIHVGIYTPEGTFEAIIPLLDDLAELGVTVLELMPVAQFPGNRNWGYDGAYPFAVQDSYGGPEGLRHLVDACHSRGLAVFLDVVYNHLGPEGNYLGDFGPYFTDRYLTPWGAALNFDGPGSDEVRRFFIENALYWLTEFHIDGLRLDAVHAITDKSALPFLEELASTAQAQGNRLGRRVHLVAESDLNDPRIIRPRATGGFGFDAQWNDDFHHALHSLLTGERDGYYRDFGTLDHLARALRGGYVYTGQYSAYRSRRHGRRPDPGDALRFVVFSQNHDQVGNRARGERLGRLVGLDELKLAASLVILSPFTPLLFMGEEYGETAPFQYFTSYTDPDLAEAVRKGRREEFACSGWEGRAPDPQDEATFLNSRLKHDLRRMEPHSALFRFYRELLRLRRENPALASTSLEDMEVTALYGDRVIFVRRWSGEDEVWAAFSFSGNRSPVSLPVPAGRWRKLLDSAEDVWLGGGSETPEALVSRGEVRISISPKACLLFGRVKEE